MTPSATLRDVAEMAAVSISTASQALNNRPNVSPETRTRVLEAAMILGYPAREETSTTRSSALSMVGMLSMHEIGTPVQPNIFYAHIQSGVENACRQRGISLMISNIEVNARKAPVDWPAMVLENRIEGLLLIGTFIEATIEQICKTMNVPMVLIDSYAPNMAIDSVLTDNGNGAKRAVQHLIDQGHRQIGLIGWRAGAYPSIEERKMGYLNALQENQIGESYIEESLLTRDAAREAAIRLLQRAPKITGIFACNDEVAIGVLEAARCVERPVPQTLSVIGFDNIELSRAVTPALTTMHVHKAWMGMIGVRHLCDRAQNPEQPKLVTRIATELILRDSVCAPYS